MIYPATILIRTSKINETTAVKSTINNSNNQFFKTDPNNSSKKCAPIASNTLYLMVCACGRQIEPLTNLINKYIAMFHRHEML